MEAGRSNLIYYHLVLSSANCAIAHAIPFSLSLSLSLERRLLIAYSKEIWSFGVSFIHLYLGLLKVVGDFCGIAKCMCGQWHNENDVFSYC